MSGLLTHIKQRIAKEGALSIADYMGECLSNPIQGYYMHNEPFGVSGDFITAPEISQMFGELIGLWAVHQWHALDKPAKFHLIELGPGRGTLMADALRAASGLPAFMEGMNLHLVETSQRLRAVQKNALAAFRPTWHDDISTLPEGPFIVIANEFLDALPIHQFEYTEHGWLERRVVVDGEKLAFTPWPPSFSIEADIAQLAAPKTGDLFEVSPLSKKIISALAGRCKTQPGCALIIDYGHSHSGYGDTLQAVKAHSFADLLETPGDADLTAHVDFAAMAKAATQAGAVAYGAVEQGAFLKSLGINERTETLQKNATPEQRKQLIAGRDRLVNEDQMGRLFKVLAIAGPKMPPPSGFQNL